MNQNSSQPPAYTPNSAFADAGKDRKTGFVQPSSSSSAPRAPSALSSSSSSSSSLSQIPPPPPNRPLTHTNDVPPIACISLHSIDMIRFTNVPESIFPAVDILLRQFWPYGVARKRNYGPSYEFRLNGTPWEASGVSRHLAPKLVKELIALMAANNWKITLTCNISNKMGALDNWFFRYTPGYAQSLPIPSPTWCVIDFNRQDRIRIIDGPMDLVTAVESAISLHWRLGLKKMRTSNGLYPEFKLRGNPWFPHSLETMEVRYFLTQLIEELNRTGYQVVTALKIFRTEDYSSPDKWVLVKM
ncbi:hypothetical protein SJAG_02143 [Schizosaccharomyces japonicus yFS275]|uniref:Uncharacterized protein n=1 Tax=Schizosaccharomyces japonicus (strain yFS275 / FY16936) TaxID=402676 RepID=B6K1N1_SCHJY|nr:hypothetical protein SJAG_02143 [Schizosaccharomyces japonicus yFS275]EEB07062.2 hypothetical protein SJAG_02143 [Schizosaccharomyces japonicus yFS275]